MAGMPELTALLPSFSFAGPAAVFVGWNRALDLEGIPSELQGIHHGEIVIGAVTFTDFSVHRRHRPLG